MKMLTLVVSLMMLLSFDLEAKSAQGFQKRFKIVRDDSGKLIGIRDASLSVKFDVRPYVEMIREQLKHEQQLMKAQGLSSYEENVRASLYEDIPNEFTNSYEYELYVQKTVDSLKELAALNVDLVFSNPVFNEIVSLYSKKLEDAILLLDPTMISMPSNSSYFYTKNVSYKIVTWALDFARKRLSSVPILNTISYVIVQVEKKITERRTYHQNMLLHYLENFNEADLGLTHDEVNLIWSSVYESRIPWFAFWESSNAKANWNKYGVNYFYSNFRQATNKLRASTKYYNEIYSRLNYAFNDVNYNGEKVIVNLFNNEGIFHARPAIAFNYDRPTQIARKRMLFNLAGLGLSFLPVSDFIKSNVSSFLKSYYENQRLTEGALFAHFETLNDSKSMNSLKNQYMNPFDVAL